jgi:hypothetical protein
MPLGRKSSEEKAVAAAEKEQRQAAEQVEKDRKAFLESPAGQARTAHERGDHVFQYSHNVMSQQAVIVKMVGSHSPQKTADPSVILNSVAAEGWDLVNGSFVFVETGQQSRDKFMASGQTVAISGATVGYYLFKRRDTGRTSPAA